MEVHSVAIVAKVWSQVNKGLSLPLSDTVCLWQQFGGKSVWIFQLFN